MTPSPDSAPVDGDANASKTTLFCGDCSHASPVDGDWTVRTVGGRRRVRCPECRGVVDERRLSGDGRVSDSDSDSGPTSETPVQRCVAVFRHYWSAWTTLLDGSRADC